MKSGRRAAAPARASTAPKVRRPLKEPTRRAASENKSSRASPRAPQPNLSRHATSAEQRAESAESPASLPGGDAALAEPRKTVRQRAKEHSRRKLVAGTMQVLMTDGAVALTTKRITKAAGMSQPSFYVHFNDMDDALRAVADELSGKLRDAIHAARLRVVASSSRETIRETYSTSVYGLINNPPLALLMLAYRQDETTPLGRRLRELDREFRQDLKADLKRMGINEKVVRELDVYIELIIGMTLTIVEGLLTKRLKDAERSISALSDASIGVFHALAHPD